MKNVKPGDTIYTIDGKQGQLIKADDQIVQIRLRHGGVIFRKVSEIVEKKKK